MKRVVLLAISALAGAAPALAQAPSGVDHAGALLDQYCSACHNTEDWAGSVAFDLLDVGNVGKETEVWEHTVRKLRGRLMPPPGAEQPSQGDVDQFVGFLESELDANTALPLAGHVPVQRLNRSEYAQAIADLLAVDIDTTEFLPMDIEVDGFDNIAAALSTSPAFLDQYINLARHVARLAVGEPVPKPAFAFYRTPSAAQDAYHEGMPFGTRGGMQITHNFPADGEYAISILDLDVGLYPRAIETQHTLVLLIDDTEVFRDSIGGPEDFALVNKGGAPANAQVVSRFQKIPVRISAGPHRVTATFIERSTAETDELVGGFVPYGGFAFEGELRVPRLLNGIEITGPTDATGIARTPSRVKLFVCEPQTVDEEPACARQVLANLATRAYRRPVTDQDIDLLLPFYETGRATAGGFDSGIEQAVVAVLASPDFLYRGISITKDIGDAHAFELSELEFASRLSFFLWGQGPDTELMALAESGTLRGDGVLQSQVERMLADPRAQSLVNNFALKWLNLDDPEVVDVDPNLFPGFSADMRLLFAEELRLFLGSVLLGDRPVYELLNASDTYLNDRLARHYGITTVFGPQFRRVELEDERRWGILGKAAMLLRTSYGDRTSPVLRGAWVLEKLMGTPPAPPPPNVNTDISIKPGERPRTVRARLEQHRQNPTCNQCHGVIDPIGLALENFTVTGQWSDVDPLADAPIDASTVLPNGVAINGPIELREQLLKRPEQFALALTERLFMYALNRELEYFDMPQVRAIVRAAAADDYTLAALANGIVRSPAFRLQALPEADGAIASVAGE